MTPVDRIPAPDPNDIRSMRQRMDAGDWYQCDAELVAQIRAAQRLTLEYEKNLTQDVAKGVQLLRTLLGSLGNDVLIRAPLRVDYGKNLHIGDGSFANFGLIALDVAPIRIGRKVQIGTNVQLLTPIHPLDPTLRAQGWEAAAPITIEDNVWVGSGAIVLPGVTIGANSVVAAGAIVTKDVPTRVVVAGNPARVVKEL